MSFFASDNSNISSGGGGGGTPDDNSVTTVKIVNNAVTLAKMADNSVGTSELVNDSVTLDKMADNSIGTLELIDDSVTQDKLADDSIGTLQIIDDAVTNDKLADDAVNTAQIADNAVTNLNMADNSVNTAELATNAVTNVKMADNSVDTPELVNGAVTNDKLASDAVTNVKILDGTITNSKLATPSSVVPSVGDYFYSYWFPGRHINMPDTIAGSTPITINNYSDGVTPTDVKEAGTNYYTRDWTSSSDNTGIGLIASAAFTKRELNPMLDIYFHISATTTDHRYHIGFVSNLTNASSGSYDDQSTFMNSQSGIVLGKGSADTTFRFRRNDGDATLDDSATTYALATGWHRVRITFTDSGVDCQYDNNSVETFTTEIPAAATALGIVAVVGREGTVALTYKIQQIKFGSKYFAAPSV